MMERAPLPDQDDCMPEDVKRSVASQQNKVDKTPGVLIRADDGSLVKIAAPSMADETDLDKMPEPTRFDKSVQGILNGRNAAMYVAMECRKRQWELEFELIEADGPVHQRVYSYSLTVGPAGSDDVIVTAGIAKGKREAKRRCCEAMVLKLDDLPPAPPLPPQMMRGGFYGRPGFRPRFPPPESEETIFRKYDRTPGDNHPNQSHPVFQLCQKAKRSKWPPPQFELVTEKIVDTIRNKHGRSNTMLYTYKVTVYPGQGQVEPKIFFGSGPTKKDAKFACGTIAWAAIQNPNAIGKPNTEHVTTDVATPSMSGGGANDPAQLAVKLAAEAAGPKKKAAEHITEDKWLAKVAKHAEKEIDLKEEIEKAKLIRRLKLEEEERQRIEIIKKMKRGSRSRSRDRKRSRSRGRRSRSRGRRSRSRSRKRSRSRDKKIKKERTEDGDIKKEVDEPVAGTSGEGGSSGDTKPARQRKSRWE